MRFSRRIAWTLGLLGPACAKPADDGRPVLERRRAWTVTAPDPLDDCMDVRNIRVCWGEPERTDPKCDDSACLVERTVPDVPASSGFRCTGSGPERTCRPRSSWASPFERHGEVWVQRHARLPDDGEWECSDTAGITVCVGGAPPAGVLSAARLPGYVCGSRPGRSRRREVCVDLSPDYPSSEQGFRCHFTSSPNPERRCQRDASEHHLGDPCDASRPCVDGARCLAGFCIPPRPEADCAYDDDCAEGRCRFGTCTEAP